METKESILKLNVFSQAWFYVTGKLKIWHKVKPMNSIKAAITDYIMIETSLLWQHNTHRTAGNEPSENGEMTE